MEILRCLHPDLSDCQEHVTQADREIDRVLDELSEEYLADSEEAGGSDDSQFRIQEYDLDFVHVPGKTQVVTDGLSRIPTRFLDVRNEEDPFAIPVMGVSVAEWIYAANLSVQANEPQCVTSVFDLPTINILTGRTSSI
ncbi:hypothetical protein N7486_008279 [Penicillium sp. IBT 16267x]|nr:hypothetical protein N7486_008279 [Penicillium sp. IBT 16267x]